MGSSHKNRLDRGLEVGTMINRIGWRGEPQRAYDDPYSHQGADARRNDSPADPRLYLG